MAHMQISTETIYDSAQRIRSLAHELLELVRLRDKVRRAEARQKARGQANRRIKARTYVDGTQLGMRSGPCWKC
jgi:hypothetical protein